MLEQIMPLWDVFLTHKKTKRPLVMATLVQVRGSSYKNKGAMMLINSDLQTYGLISGGCLERDLAEHSEEVFSDGVSKVITYDLSDDSIFGLGAGCDGTIQVLLQALNTKNKYQPFSLFNPLINEAQQATLSLNYNKESHFFNGFQYEVKNNINTSHKNIAADKKLNPKSYSLIELIPPLKIAIVGTGPDIEPICQLIELMNWHGYLVDHRLKRLEAFNNFKNINLIEVDLNNLANTLVKPFDAVLLMTHNLDRDVLYMSFFNQFKIPYLGLLGSKNRKDKVLLKANLITDRLNNKLYAPIGLDIGSHSPEQIALSIIAQIQLILNHPSKQR